MNAHVIEELLYVQQTAVRVADAISRFEIKEEKVRDAFFYHLFKIYAYYLTRNVTNYEICDNVDIFISDRQLHPEIIYADNTDNL